MEIEKQDNGWMAKDINAKYLIGLPILTENN